LAEEVKDDVTAFGTSGANWVSLLQNARPSTQASDTQ